MDEEVRYRVEGIFPCPLYTTHRDSSIDESELQDIENILEEGFNSESREIFFNFEYEGSASTYELAERRYFPFDNISLLYNCEIDWYLKITQWLCTTDYVLDDGSGLEITDNKYNSLEECNADCPVDPQPIGDEYYTKYCIEDLPD